MKNKKLVSKIIDGILNFLIVIFAIFLLISMYTVIQVKVLGNDYSSFFGYSLFEVQTGSMSGTIEAGDWILIKDTKNVKVGDIVTYRHSNDFITHRVIESYGGTYVTKGDANNTADEPIDQSQIVGKVVKTMAGFGFLRKTLFNPTVIILLIITLYLFNLTFKQGKSKFDMKVEEIIEKIKNKFIKEDKKEPVKEEIKEEKVAEKIELPKEEVIEEIEELKEVEEAPVAHLIEPEKKVIEEPVETDEEKLEEELSKTSMFRVISIDRNAPKTEPVKKEETPEEKEERIEEELSKTSMFRFITINHKEEEEEEIVEEITPPKEEVKEKEDKTIKIMAEEVVKKEPTKKITRDYINSRIKSKKSKNIVDKLFFVKGIVYDEILDTILKPCKSYIINSSMREQFMNQYFNFKYYGTDDDRKNVRKLIKNYSDELIKKNIRDENKVNTIKAYRDSFIFISCIEDNRISKYKTELKKVFKYDDETLKSMAFDIGNIIKYTNEYLEDVLEKLKTNTFEVKYNKFAGQKYLYGVFLNHNISFSKVYSDYIVDKTYSEGVVSEDKLEVLLNILLCRIVFDMLRFDYSPRYFVYIPKSLYDKNKKLDSILGTVDNDYAKNHIYFLTSASNMIKNKEDFLRLRKKGYSFACIFDKQIEYKHDDLGYIYMNDYFFIESSDDKKDICKKIPRDITNKIIEDNISKKVGDYGGDK